jgi:hypothetical protein
MADECVVAAFSCEIGCAGRAGSELVICRVNKRGFGVWPPALRQFVGGRGAYCSTERESCMNRIGFDDADYSVVVTNGAAPNSWRWQIYRAGRSSPIEQSPNFYRTMAAANKAGKATLKGLLAKLNTQGVALNVKA